MDLRVFIGVLALLLAALGALFYFTGVFTSDEALPPVEEAPQSEPLPTQPHPAAVEPAAAEPLDDTVTLPEPEVSAVAPAVLELPGDDVVLELIRDWPVPEPWLEGEHFVERGVALAVAASDGALPRKLLGNLVPEGTLAVSGGPKDLSLSADNAHRYDIYFDIADRVEPATTAAMIRAIKPLIRQSLAKLGDPRSIEEILSTLNARVAERSAYVDKLPATPRLVQPGVGYRFADAELEALTEFDKLLIRIGPEHRRALAAYLNACVVALGSPAT